MSDQKKVTQEYVERAAAILEEVLDHYVVLGIPRLTPEQEEEGAAVPSILQISGHLPLLCMLAEQGAVRLHERRLLAEEEATNGDGPSLS